ncbi:DnaJ domain-containing protein, partial [Pelagophyceae sp. CCMP2097]
VLGVARGASPEEIRLAHRKRMLETHPDKNLGDESAPRRFLGVQAAFRVLSDADRRALYDRKLDLG